MGLFSRKAQEVIVEDKPKQETRSFVEPDYSYSWPLSLSFLRNYSGRSPMNYSTVFAAVELVSNTLASLPIHIHDINTGEIVRHPINDALENGLLTQYMLIKQLVSDVYLHGNAFVYIDRTADGSVKSLTYLQPGEVVIDYNSNTHKLFYLAPTVKRGRIEPVNMLHFLKNAADGVNGKPVTMYASGALKIANASDKTAESFFDSGCAVSGILKSQRPLTEAQKMDIKSSWQQSMAKDSSGLAVLGADLDYQSVGTNAADSQLLETREFNITDVARFFNISPQLLGDLSHTVYNSVEQAQLDFLSHVIQPLIVNFEQEMTRKLLKPSERNVYRINIAEEHLILADKASTANYYSTLCNAGLMTANEARHRLGLPPVEGGDELRIPFSDANQNSLSPDENDNINKSEEENGNQKISD